jgi:flagellar biosynthesis anti-sigma factor FlgM
MRIGLNAPNPQEISTERASTSSASTQSAAATPQTDKFSGDTVSLKSLTAKTLEQPEVRQERVDNFQQMIASGQYHLDSQKSAEAMLSN